MTSIKTNCWEFNQCNVQKSCPAFPSNGTLCWQVKGTLCRNEEQGSYDEKIGACRSMCTYYSACMSSNF